VLQILRLCAVDVSWEVEVEVVLRLADLCQRNHARVAGDFELAYKCVNDAVDILRAKTVFVAVFDEALGGIDHENTLARIGVFFVKHDDAGGDSGAVKELRRESDNAFDVAALDDLAPNSSLRSAAKQNAMRKVHSGFSRDL